MFHHQFLKPLDLARDVFFAHVFHLGTLHGIALQFLGFFARLFAVNPVNQVTHFFHDGTRRDAVRQVVRHLLDPAALGFADGFFHRLGHLVGIQNGPALQVAGGAADGLDQRTLRAQKTFLVGIQNRHQRHLGNIQAFAQQVDAHQHVKGAQSQVAQDLDPLHGVDVAVQVAHLDTVVAQIIGQLLGHALGQRGDQHPLVLVNADADLLQHVVDLAGGRAHLHLGVDQSGGAHQLLHYLAGMVFFPLARGGGHKHGLAHLGLELFKLERPVVQRAGQPKAVTDQRGLARAVAVVHAAKLTNQHVGLVQEHHRVFGQVIGQRGGRRTGRRASQMP